MIYTVTLNPSVDYIMHVSSFEIGKTNRTDAQDMVPGGKGINVSTVLDRFNTQTTLLGFVAGFTGRFIEEKLAHLDTKFITTDGATRINVKLKTGDETEINGQSPVLTEQDVAAFEEAFTHITAEDTVVLCGSLPHSLPKSYYKTLAMKVKEKGARVIIDTSGEPLLHALEAKPTLIKPNKAELEALYEVETSTQEEMEALAKRAVQDGAEHVLVSLGGDGAMLVTKDATYIAEAPKGNVINTVGAGDSMVAGFIYATAQDATPEEILRHCIAFGSATAFSTELATKDEVSALLPTITTSRKEG
ncbi:1-phosphofructokinase [Paenalkalicoccus suaedae]|uniref:Tagatose-6-phosphate kinase n=1 Tax=Paenalkalicoccus suaedae TaxID=2592382 RepID=A0A859FA65_9BACI|nr:1-phosphofructokinase [Paenalkalicoccus suaedae]QKS70143.1 1-phosphofructokinase [Paenalkalicoccus suaedae]